MINIIGQFFGTSGYASHTRYLANELNKLIDCKLVTNVHPGAEREINDQELQMIKREQSFDINLIITHPVNWKTHLTAKRNFVYLVWEGDSVPSWMVEECMNKNIEKIIVPSTHTAQALKNTVKSLKWNKIDEILDKVALIPHGVDLDIFHPTHDIKGSNVLPFIFLANKGLRNLEDRGGLQYLIKAYLSEFKKEENVELIVKINPAYGIPNLQQMFPELSGEIPKIRFISDNYTKSQLNDLYNECDVFVSPTRSEAFNIPCLEAMACGKPVITTNFGGQTDFVNEENGWLVDYDLTEVQHELEYEGVKWATPKLDDLKTKLRIAYSKEYNYNKKSKSVIDTSKKLTWANTAKKIHSLIL